MTKKNYVLIAKAIRENVREFQRGQGLEAINATAIAMAVAFKQENARFDYFRFLEACGL